MRVGVFALFDNFGNSMRDAIKDQLRLIELADELNFDEVWLGEHHFNSFSVVPDPISLLSYIAAKTKNIRIGSAGFLAPYYNVVRLGEHIAMLDNLSDGRLNVGFAKGGFAPDTRHFLQTNDDLFELMLESIKAIELLLSGEKIDFDSKFIKLKNSFITPNIMQKKIPSYIATFSSPKTIEFAAKSGYGLMMSQGATLKECVDAAELYYSIAKTYPQIVVMRVLYMDENKEVAKHNIKPVIDHFIKSMRAAGAELSQPHFNLEEHQKLLSSRADFFSATKFLDAAIFGNEDDCLATLMELKSHIPNLHIGLKPSSYDPKINQKMLVEFSQKIMPNLK